MGGAGRKWREGCVETENEEGREGGREACCASAGFSEGHVYGPRVWPSRF